MMPLHEAALQAQREVFRGRRPPQADATELLDFIALAIAAHIRIYGSRESGAPPALISPAEIERGTFRGGAKRFVIDDSGLLVTGLVVRRLDVKGMLRKLSSTAADPR